MIISLLISFVIAVGQFWAVVPSIQGRNSIEGRVTNSEGRPISDLRILLQNEGYSHIKSTISDGSGRFRFDGLASGVYYVQVEPGATGFERQQQRVEATAFSERRGGSGREIFRVDIVLAPVRMAKNRNVTANTTGILFHQDVPEVARKEYERALKSLEKDSFESASQSLKHAIELFPDYYDAMELLGTEYVKRQDHKSALPLLTRAVEINKDGWRGFYSLGIAQFETKERNEGIKSLQRAVELNPESANTNMWLGIALAQTPGKDSEAIQSLEKATKIAKDNYPMAYYYLGGLYMKNNHYREAADAFETLLRVYPQAGDRDKIKNMIEQLRQKAKEQGKK